MHNWKWLLLLVCLACLPAAYGQHRPLKADDAETLETGRIRAEVGVEFLQDQGYSLSGLRGNLIRLGVAAVHMGVGEFAEFQMSGVIQDYLSITSRDEPVVPPEVSGDATSDFGNLVLGTKLKLAGEKGKRPAMAFKFAVELPNANQGSGLGNDETEFYASLLFKKHFGGTQIMADLGLAILGSPVNPGSQTDSLTYGAAAVIPVHPGVNLVAEISGRQGPSDRAGNENKTQARAGIQLRTGGIRWDAGVVAGFQEYDPNSGIVFGMTYEFQAFKRNKSPVRIP